MNQVFRRGPVAELYASGTSALKVFPGRFDRRTLATIRREQARLARAGASVLPLTGIEVLDGRHALRMELCVGSLADRVHRAGPLASPEVATLCESLSRALAAAHRLGVLHGGLTPANVLYRTTGEVVLADFGVAQRQMFPRDLMCGVEWQAPETLRTGEVDARADLYGLGAVLHFALTGESPHPSRIGETTAERLDRVFKPSPAISRPDVPVRLATAIGRMLAPDPARRSLPWTGAPAQTPPRPRSRTWLRVVIGSATALAVLLVVELMPRSAPDGAGAPEPGLALPVIVLDDPIDLGENRVRLSWTTTGGRLDKVNVRFWAKGTGESSPGNKLLDGTVHTATVLLPSDDDYCFQVHGTAAAKPVESEPKPLHGANCEDT